MKHSSLTPVAVAALAGIWCVALWGARWIFGGSGSYFFLNYNLMLAAIPVLISTGLPQIRSRAGAVGLGAVWLLFFPNAPCLLTDLIHLRPRPESAPFWFDWLMLASFAGTGLLFGCVSLAQMHHCLRRKLPDWRCEAVILGLLSLTGFGIYLGRFARWNSWDILTRPEALFSHIAESLLNVAGEPRMLAYSFGVTVMLGLAYFGPLVIFRSLHAEFLQHRDDKGGKDLPTPPA